MKRIISLTTALCLVLGTILPVYAADDIGIKAAGDGSKAGLVPGPNINGIIGFYDVNGSTNSYTSGKQWADGVLSALQSMSSGSGTYWNTFLGSMPQGWLDWSVFSLAWKDYEDIMEYWVTGVSPTNQTYAAPSWHAFTLWYDEVMDWLYPAQYTGTPLTNNELSLWDYTKLNTNNVANVLIPTTWDIETDLQNGLLKKPLFFGSGTGLQYQHNSTSDWGSVNTTRYWGTSFDNKIDLLNWFMYSNVNTISRFSSYMVKDVPSVLSIWDSQGDNLTQSTWTPTSAFNGTYKYLAYLQRDVARLTYVFANDEELEARELAKENQEQVVDDFINPNGSGAASGDDFSDMAGLSAGLKDNFSTGQNASGVFNIFSNNSSTNWFSNDTKNALDTSTRTRDVYDTPLLDSYYEEVYSLFDGME